MVKFNWGDSVESIDFPLIHNENIEFQNIYFTSIYIFNIYTTPVPNLEISDLMYEYFIYLNVDTLSH